MAFDGDPFAFYGKCIIEDHLAAFFEQFPHLKPDPTVPDAFDVSDEVLRFVPSTKVGILGAGVGGLYTALILDSLNISYEILEATNRVGGRISTYKFPKGGDYDYYEEGAMRFPLPKKDTNEKYKNGLMKRLAKLIDYPPLNKGQDRLKDKLIPYYYTVREGSTPGFCYFNGIREQISSRPKGPFAASQMNVGADYVRAGADAINSDVVNPFVRMIINDLRNNTKTGWKVLKANDTHSARSYMASKYLPSNSLKLPPQHLPSSVINWCALLGGGGSGGYDCALAEVVFDALAFGEDDGSGIGDVDWRCFKGGSETLTKTMEKYIIDKGASILTNKRVTAISTGSIKVSLRSDISEDEIPSDVKETFSKSENTITTQGITVTVNGNETKSYRHVISTLPLPVLRMVDLNRAGLTIMQRNALRALQYGPSIKIAILFKSNWWTTKLGIVGGQSFTDLPIWTIVYPSYGVNPNDPPCKVLIASYTWVNDAHRLGALSTTKGQEELKELVLRNLAEAHGGNITYKFLEEEFVDMHVKDWTLDKNAMGAFVQFSPGEFEDLYTSLNGPAANKRLHFAGEALSTRHGWVVGALDSAWKAVYQYLLVTKQKEKLVKFFEIWGKNVEWTSKSTLFNQNILKEKKLEEPKLFEEYLALTESAKESGAIPVRGY